MALNLGIYTCDLSFASLYEQTQLLIDYMNAAKKMADGLGILKAIEQEDIDKLEENINNSEVIMEVVSQTFMNSNSYLEDNGQPATAATVLVGGWIEGLYISTQLVDMKEFNGNKLVTRIIDQKLSIDILLNLLNSSKGNPSVDEIIVQVAKLKAVFDKIKIDTTPVRTEYDQASNTTMLKSEVKTDMTPEVFTELSAIVAEIRNSFVK
jgi:archaellum component FlaC